jgi:hypothetical protein
MNIEHPLGIISCTRNHLAGVLQFMPEMASQSLFACGGRYD